MEYVSTRGQAPVLGFADALLAGLARDGGLYVPAFWPRPLKLNPFSEKTEATVSRSSSSR